MVGGKVVEVAEVPGREDVLYVNCADLPRGRKKPDFCAILIEHNETAKQVQIGDSLWWQGRVAYWTPQDNIGGHLTGMVCHKDYDIQIPRVGYSGVAYEGVQAKGD